MGRDYRLPNMGGNTISTRLTVRLIEELRSGKYSECRRLPSEMELAEKYGVSRTVIRDVLGHLEREGYVERGRGVGTIVNQEVLKLKSRLDLKREYSELIFEMGCVPSVDLMRLSIQPASAKVASKLQVDEGTELIVSEKRMLASGRPIIFSTDYLPIDIFEGSQWKALDWGSSVFELLRTKCGIVVDTNITEISAVCGSDEVRKKLNTQQDEALMLLKEIGYCKLSSPILYSVGYYTNFLGFTMLRKLL